MRRVLAIDYGEKRIGIAISDPLQLIAKPLTIIVHTNQRDDFDAIARVCAEQEIEKIVVGLPTDSYSEIGPQAEIVIRWARKLGKVIKVPIVFFDETSTSQFAHGLRKGRRDSQEPIDHLAAAKILQDFLLTGGADGNPGKSTE